MGFEPTTCLLAGDRSIQTKLLDHNIIMMNYDNLESDIETIKAQTKSSKPKKNIVLEAFKSIKNILASISVIVSSHPELIEAITEIMKHLGGV